MIIGRIEKNERTVRFELDLSCSACGKGVPGGMKASEKLYGTKEFQKTIRDFKGSYLCGICRDKERTS